MRLSRRKKKWVRRVRTYINWYTQCRVNKLSRRQWREEYLFTLNRWS